MQTHFAAPELDADPRHRPAYVDNRPLLVAGKPELREYKAVFVIGDEEVSLFSDEVTVNCAPLV